MRHATPTPSPPDAERPVAPPDAARAWIVEGVALALVALVWLLLEAFRTYDWNRGATRVALLWALLAVVALAPLAARRVGLRPAADGPLAHLLLGAAALGLGVSLATGIGAAARTVASDRIALDQGENAWRALQAVRAGRSPWSRGVLLDPAARDALVVRLGASPECLRDGAAA